jgi:hypothetical protein
MGMTAEEIIKNFGLSDGADEIRYEEAVRLSPVIDEPVVSCFRAICGLERKGLIEMAEDIE